jgi:hypothetical protein
MNKPRIFLGSSGKQADLLQALTDGLGDVAHVEPWTVVFNPGVSTLERLVELTREVDFAAFVFAQDDWTAVNIEKSPTDNTGQASPRDNVVFEAGLFGGVLGMRRTFILHAKDSKLPTDLLGLTCVRYDGSCDTDEVDGICKKIRNAIENEGRATRLEGLWWQFSLTPRTKKEPSAVSLVKVSRDRNGSLEVSGRAWQEDGTLSAQFRMEAIKEKTDPPGIFYYYNGERPLHPDAPQVWGTGEFKLESADRASGYWITRTDSDPSLIARTSGVYLRALPEDLDIMDGHDDQKRLEMITERLRRWKSMRNF